eukprot:5948241-Amphidinium_carterae.1
MFTKRATNRSFPPKPVAAVTMCVRMCGCARFPCDFEQQIACAWVHRRFLAYWVLLGYSFG